MPPDQRLTKLQRNDVLNAITQNGLEPSAFEWSEIEAGDDFNGFRLVSRVTHASSGYFALFDYLTAEGAPYFLFSPGMNTREDRYTSQIGNRWHLHVPYIEAWAQRLKLELEAPDQWGWIEQSQLLTGPDAADDRFSPTESEQLRTQIESVRRLLLEQHAETTAQQEAINDRLDYLVDATHKQGRRDWYFLALGVIFQLVTQIQLPPHVASQVWQAISSGLPPLLRG